MTNKLAIADIRNVLQPVQELIDHIRRDRGPLRASDLLPGELLIDAHVGLKAALEMLAELEQQS